MIEVRYITHAGDDLMVVNAARVSFAKESNWDEAYVGEEDYHRVLSDRDAKLIRYLADHGHWTPFAHPQITLHVKAPIFVRTQCFKHKVGFVENEVSRRYVDDEPELYLPHVWRGRAENKKQGSAGVVREVRFRDRNSGDVWFEDPGFGVSAFYSGALALYEDLIDSGVAPEQARMVLPQSMMTEWYWTGSLAAWARFCRQRTGKDAQAETGEVARMCASIIQPLFPVAWAALTA